MSRFNKSIYRYAFIAFCTIMLSILYFGISAAAAVDYDSLSSDVLEHIKVRTGLRNLIRAAQFAILKTIAMIVDEFDEAIDVIMHLNLYDLLDGKFSWDLQPLAWAVLSLFIIIAGFTLMVFADKLKITDTLRSIIISSTIIVAFPTLISAFSDLKDKGVDTVDALSSDINQVDENGLVYGLGDTLLSSNIVAITDVDGQLHYYNEVKDRYPGSIYHININDCLDNSVWDKEPVGIDSIDGSQTRYSELTTLNMMDLLGLRAQYVVYVQALENDYGVVVSDGQYASGDGSAREPDYIQDGTPHWNEVTMTVDEYRRYLINLISTHTAVVDAGLQSEVAAKNTIEEALEVIKDIVIRRLNIQQNQYYAAHGTSTTYFYRELITQDDYESMAWYDQLITQVKTLGYPSEYIYAFDMNFCFTLFILIVTAICLLFAGFKLGTMLYDILFMSLIGSVAAATDATSAGRAKKIVMELISSYTIFIVVAFVLKLYLISVTGIYNNIDNIIAQIILLIAGAKFVIDGPDIVVKLLGIDAGVKSGAATLTAMHSAASMVQNVGRTVGRVGGTALAAPSKIASVAGSMYAAANDIKGADGIAEKVGAAVENTPVGQAFKQSALNNVRTNSDYSDYKAGQPDKEHTSPAKVAGNIVGSAAKTATDVSSALKSAGSSVKNSVGSYFNSIKNADGFKDTTTSVGAPLSKLASNAVTDFKDGYAQSRGAANNMQTNNAAAPAQAFGRDGKDGSNGRDGKDGIDGLKGADGRNGENAIAQSSEKSTAVSSTEHSEPSSGRGFTETADNYDSSTNIETEMAKPNDAGSGFAQSEQRAESLVDSYADRLRQSEHSDTFADKERKEESNK